MPPKAGEKGLSNRDKGIVAGVVLCLVIALVIVYFTWHSQQPQVVRSFNLPPGSALKLQAMKAEKEGQESTNQKDSTGKNLPSIR